MNKNFYKNKKILITGCTGFTGGWLILYLQMQGAKIFGYSKKPPFNNSIFKLLKLNKNITFLEGNIENFKKLNNFFKKNKINLVVEQSYFPINKNKYSKLDVEFSASFGRQLEYYTGMVFKIDIKTKSKNINIINGGRYDNLISNLGSKKNTPAVGAAINLNAK